MQNILVSKLLFVHCMYSLLGPPVQVDGIRPGQTWRALFGQKDAIKSIAFSADQKAVAASSYDGTICIWATDTGELLYQRKENAAPILILSPKAETLFAYFDVGGGWLHRVQVRKRVGDVLKWEYELRPDLLLETVQFKLSHDGRTLGFSPEGGSAIRFWDAETGKSRGEINIAEGYIQAVAFARTTASVALATYREEAVVLGIWDLTTSARSRVICKVLNPSGTLRLMKLSHDDKTLGEYWDDGTIVLRDVSSGKAIHKLSEADTWSDLAFTAQNRLLATIQREAATMDVVQLGTEKPIMRIQCEPDRMIRSAAFSHDASMIAVGLDNGHVRLWTLNAKAAAK